MDYCKLRGRIVEKCGSQVVFAKRMGISERSVSLKLSGKRMFKQSEIEKALHILDLAESDIAAYFFTRKS